jgi:hypothetical protein
MTPTQKALLAKVCQTNAVGPVHTPAKDRT